MEHSGSKKTKVVICSDKVQMDINIFFILALIVVFSKIFALFLKRFNFPPVFAMILVGIVVGPTGFNLITGESDRDVVKIFAEVGLFILIFFAGLETDINSLKKLNKNSIYISIGGVVVPLFLGYLVTYFFTNNFTISVIMGLILSSTSASVSIITLYKLGRLKTVEGNTITNAAIVDDIIGIIILSVVGGLSMIPDFNPEKVALISLVNIALFIFIFILGILILPKLISFLSFLKLEFVYFIFGIIFMLIFAYFAGEVNSFTIISSYFAGIFLSKSEYKSNIEDTISIAQLIFVSIFFVFIGLQLNLRGSDLTYVPYIITLVVTAFFSKLFGSGIMAKLSGFDIKRSLRIGVGMTPRGEIPLIIASITYYYGNSSLITDKEFFSIILIVILTIFVAKYLLKFLYFEKKVNKG